MASGEGTLTLEWVGEDGDFFATEDEEGRHKAGRTMKPNNFQQGEKVHIQDHDKRCFVLQRIDGPEPGFLVVDAEGDAARSSSATAPEDKASGGKGPKGKPVTMMTAEELL